jgi:hypothetical protein
MAEGVCGGSAFFNCGTCAIEIDHCSFTARYDEVDKNIQKIFVSPGNVVRRGQKLAIVGRLVGITVPSNILHLELYETTAPSSLTVRGHAPFQRRANLIDSTY